ncbi:MAG: FecR domain-containing protein [Ideonella sp.]|nr:FecR domain-containing protein [Ideonella sp.]MBL0151263.1 FecR domain-containing protein [Ideonella sp.]
MKHPDEIEQAAAQWLARDDAGELDEQGQAALERWLQQDTAHRVAWLRLRAAWRQADGMRGLAAAPSAGLPRVADSGAYGSPRGLLGSGWRRQAVGGGVALALCATLVWSLLPSPAPAPTPGQFATAVGVRQAITLADGSRITLNTRTRARAQVDERQRTVWLEDGEAFFDVAKDRSRPFVVHAGAQRITVMGTKFSVRLTGSQTQVTVLEGRVRVEPEDSSAAQTQAVVVSTRESAVTGADSLLVVQRTPQQVSDALAWRAGRLAFDQRTLADIAAELNRYNATQLVVHEDVAEMRLSGSFDAVNVDGFVRLLSEGYGIVVRREGPDVHLSR